MVALSLVRFLVRVIAVSEPLNRVFVRWGIKVHEVSSALGVTNPIVLAQALAMLGVAAIAVISWRYYDLIRAWSSLINTTVAERLVPLQPIEPYFTDRTSYRIVLGILVFAFGYGLFRVVRLRKQQDVRHGTGGVAILIAVIVVILLMDVLPYRIFFSDSERLDFLGLRCYQIGAHQDNVLIYCPDSAPPRNRVVKRDDPAIRRTGVIESVFTARGF
jgi:hypothetical protein